MPYTYTMILGKGRLFLHDGDPLEKESRITHAVRRRFEVLVRVQSAKSLECNTLKKPER